LQLDSPVAGTAQLFAGEAVGLIVSLPGWRYPVVFNTATGQAQYDTFGGRWGEQRQLDRFLQMYAVELAKLEARRHGHSVTEESLADGSIKVIVQVGGTHENH
jgi:hypothetical protein